MLGFNGGLIGKTRTYTTIAANSGIWTPNERTVVVRVPPVIATGGTVTDVPFGGVNYRVHKFTTATFVKTFFVTSGGEVEYLIVAGGGGGANLFGGGGGGGVLQSSAFSVIPGDYPVEIGAGGAGETGNQISNNTSGGNSSIFGETAIGGGRGGRDQAGFSGGSGGGGGAWGSGNGSGFIRGGGSPTADQGFAGGISSNLANGSGGGGGGAGQAGSPGASGAGGNGGNGIVSSITGFSLTYGGGGAGGAFGAGTTGGTGGTGGGGNSPYNQNAGNGTDELGGGGAGFTGDTYSVYPGGTGGSGVVYIRYRI